MKTNKGLPWAGMCARITSHERAADGRASRMKLCVAAVAWLRMAVLFAMAAALSLASAAAPALQTNQTVLRYRELPFRVDSWTISVTPVPKDAPFTNLPAPGQALQYLAQPKDTPFTNQPAPGGTSLYLAQLNVNGKPLGMAWDQKAGRLWLDLNRNRDLTDDPEGVFQTPGRGDEQTFTNVHLTAPTRRGPVTLCLDLVIRPQNRATWTARAEARCCLVGKLVVGGEAWQVAYSAPFLDFASPVQDGVFMARPWDESLYGAAWPASMPAGMPGFSLRGPEADGVLWAQASKQLHGEHEWTLLGRETETNGPPALALEVRSEARETGVVDVSGSNVTRLTLRQGGRRFAAPLVKNRARLAAGQYTVEEIQISSGPAQATANPFSTLKVVQGQTNRLNAGLPLTAKVTAIRRGDSLRLDYRMVDAGGTAYRLASMGTGTLAKPEFSIWQGKRRVASGSFEYG